VTDAEISRDGHLLPFDSLVIRSGYVNNVKKLEVASNEFKGSVEGDFSIKDLPNSFEIILNRYYPSYISIPRRIPRNQDFKFDITTFYVDEYLQMIDSSISGFNNSHFEGRLNLGKNELDLTADVPQFKYKQYNFEDVKLKATGDIDSLTVIGSAKNIFIKDSLNIPEATFAISARNDSSLVSIRTGRTQTLEKADMNALVRTFPDGVEIEFEPSTLTINGKTWSIDANGVLALRKNSPSRADLLLSEGEQRIRVTTKASTRPNSSDLMVELTKINVGDIAPYVLPNNRLEGLVSGHLLIEDPTGHLKVSSDDIKTQFLQMDNDSLGEVVATLRYDQLTKELLFKGNTLNPDNYLGFDGHLFLGDPEKAKKNNIISLKARNFDVKYVQRFLSSLFSDMQGSLTGDITLQGDLKDVTSVTGKGRLHDAGLKVNFTQVFYKIKDTDIDITPQEINLNGFVLTDTVTKNPVYISGGIEHESFRNMFYDLYISTRKPGTKGDDNNRPVQLLNTTFKDNKQFYGNVKGTGSLSLAGPQSDMFMKIDAFASSLDSSFITIPASGSRESGSADFLVERKFGKELNDTSSGRNLTNIIYDVDVTANPLVNVKVILDELTGDIIKGRGRGTLKIRSGSAEPLSIRGRYDISEGDYLFTFQSFFKKPFVLKKDANNYIEWSGDPNDAKVNLTAIYTASGVSYAPLAKAWGDVGNNVSKARGDVYVVATLTDKLFQPHIEFGLDYPENRIVNSDPALAFSLQQLQKNTNEMNKQATYLVVFGTFGPMENAGLFNSEYFPELVSSSISGIFFNEVNKKIKDVISSIFNTQNVNFKFNSSLYNRNPLESNQFNLGSNINASAELLIRKNVIISIGGSVEGLFQTGTVQQDVQWLPNVSLELLLNPSGSFRANLFYKQNIDYLTTNTGLGRSNRKGIGLSYRKEAERFWDLFRRNRRPAPEKKKQPAEKDGTE